MMLLSATETENTPMPRMRVAPLLPLRCVVSLIDLNEDKVLALLRSRKIAWAWDVGLGRRNSELRILPASVLLYQAGIADKLTWQEISQALLPELSTARPGVVITRTALDVQRILNASQTHVETLIQSQQLRRITEGRPGPGGSCRVEAQSLLTFLQNRRMR